MIEFALAAALLDTPPPPAQALTGRIAFECSQPGDAEIAWRQDRQTPNRVRGTAMVITQITSQGRSAPQDELDAINEALPFDHLMGASLICDPEAFRLTLMFVSGQNSFIRRHLVLAPDRFYYDTRPGVP
ncbi:MAG: hypothetical protein REJ23_02005 [Brevundimonas sp.]|nr:hypothetical protein [Brevundimonas sp.]